MVKNNRGCEYNNTLEMTYSYGGHIPDFYQHEYFEDVIQLSRCCLLKPNWYVNSKAFIRLPDIMDYVFHLENPEKPYSRINHPMCKGHFCNLSLNSEIKEVMVGLSYACNLNCYNCWYRGHHIDTPKQKELYFYALNNLRKHELSNIVLTNKGEPFFYKKEIMEYLKSLSIKDTKRISAVTNGNCFDAEDVKEISSIHQETCINFSFMFSIDSISEEVYRIVRCGGDFNKVLNNLTNCIKYFGENNVMVSFTCKDFNLKEVSMAKDFYKSNFGVETQISFDYFNPTIKEVAEKEYGFTS